MSTIAELLFPLRDPIARNELETHRMSFERTNGPTNLTLRYTSTWPVAQQRMLWNSDRRRYFEGLPPFVQSYLLRDHTAGIIDELPISQVEGYLQAIESGQTRCSKGRTC